MSVSDARSTARRHVVAVGPTREDAAAPYGLDHSDLFLTSYADLSVEVDLDDVDSVDLAAGEGLYTALDLLCPRLDQDLTSPAGRVLLRHAHSSRGRTGAEQRGDREVQSGRAVSCSSSRAQNGPAEHRTRPSCRDRRRDSRDRTYRRRRPAGHHTGGAEEPDERRRRAGESDTEAGSAQPQAPQAPPAGPPEHHQRVAEQSTTTRRRCLALAVLAMALLALGLLSGSSELVVVVCSSARLLGLGATGLLFMTVSCWPAGERADRSHRADAAAQPHHRAAAHDGYRAEHRAGRGGSATLPFMQEYLEAMAAASSTSSANLTDQIQCCARRLSGCTWTRSARSGRAQPARPAGHQRSCAALGGWAVSVDFNVLMLQELIHTAHGRCRVRKRHLDAADRAGGRQYGLSTGSWLWSISRSSRRRSSGSCGSTASPSSRRSALLNWRPPHCSTTRLRGMPRRRWPVSTRSACSWSTGHRR